jgi:aspartate/methionine/tyrosine aminotransferase
MSSPMGAYTSNSKGHSFIRKSIAEFINERDGPSVNSNWNNIYLTNGASEAVRTSFKLLIR